MADRVYIETEIPSFYHTLRTDVESVARMHWTRPCWTEYAPQFDLFTSPAVILVLQPGSSEKTAERLDLIAEIEVLDFHDDVDRTVGTYCPV